LESIIWNPVSRHLPGLRDEVGGIFVRSRVR
jgi:hypothetical protein